MKIIHLISGGDVGGAKTHVHTLLQGLCATQTVRLVCFTAGDFADEAKMLGIPTTVLETNLSSTVKQLVRLIRHEGYELIHCHGARANLVGSLLRKKLDIPVVSTVHSDYRLDYMGRPMAALTYGSINKLALRRLDSWIGVSDAMADMLIDRGFDPERIYSIYNGVRFERDKQPQERSAYLQELGVETTADSVVFGIAARINPVKDMKTLIRAFSQTVQLCPHARLLIAGDGIQRQEIEQLAGQLCPKGSVIFTGWINDTDSFYNALDVNVLTSVSETFPYALTEGARMRCATVSSRVGGVPKLIDHGINGLLFDARDVTQLAAHLTTLAQNQPLCRTLGERLYEKTKNEFSVEVTVKKQIEIYHTILRRRARRSLQRRDGVMICGAYGKGNGGDDAILTAIISQLRSFDADLPICVLSRNPKETERENRVAALFTFNYPRIWRQMRRTAVYLSGGGSLIQDATSSRSLWYYLNSIQNAKKRGNRVMMFGCGIGPVTGKGNRKRTARVLHRFVDEITLRDEESARELERLDVTGVPVQVTADMAFLLERAPAGEQQVYINQCGITPQNKYLLFALRPWLSVERRLDAFAEAAAYASKRYGVIPVLYAMEPARDAVLCGELARRLREREVEPLLLWAPENARLILGLFGEMQAVVAMRLHALIFAASQGVPVAGVAYDPKVSSFMTQIGEDNCCSIADADTQTLCRMIDRVLTGAAADEARAQKLRERAQGNCLTVKRLLEQAKAK